jgi:hypothetical protein
MAEAAIGYDLDLDMPLYEQGFSVYDVQYLEYSIESEFNLEDDLYIGTDCTLLKVANYLHDLAS